MQDPSVNLMQVHDCVHRERKVRLPFLDSALAVEAIGYAPCAGAT